MPAIARRLRLHARISDRKGVLRYARRAHLRRHQRNHEGNHRQRHGIVIDRKYIGHAFPPYTVQVERGRLRFFAKAIGETNRIYTDDSAALPIPPTFLFSLENEVPEPFGWLTPMGVHFDNLLHGEQSFKYYAMVYAGDRVT